MSESGPTAQASATCEVAYPVEQVWRAMATLLPYCSVCDVSAVVDSPGELGLGTEFRAFPGRINAQGNGAAAAEGGMAGEIVEWSPRQLVATLLRPGQETVLVRVEMVSATPDTTLVTIGVEVTARTRSRFVTAISRSSYARMARLTVEGEIAKLPAHLALLDQPELPG